MFVWNLPFYCSEEQLPREDEGSSVALQEGKPSEQARSAAREAVLRAPQRFGSCRAVQILIAFKHTQLTDYLMKSGKRKVDRCEGNWKEERKGHGVLCLSSYCSSLLSVGSKLYLSKQRADNDS